jgi:hypothetical protein
MEIDWFWLRLGMRLLTWLLPWFLSQFKQLVWLGWKLVLGCWNIPILPPPSPLLSPTLSDPKV